MVICIPQRAVSSIMDAYWGSTSDRLIIKRSDKDKFRDHDSINADMDIIIQNLLASRNVQNVKREKSTWGT